MKKSEFDAIRLIRQICIDHIGDKLFAQHITQRGYEEFGIPIDKINDVVTLRKEIEVNDTFFIFLLFKIFNLDSIIPKYFTASEIKMWNNEKYEEIEKFAFPINFDVIPITDKQWVGKITVHQLMEFNEAGLINYNKNTQRTLRMKMKNGEETYGIYINQKAVKKIEDSFINATYIPNTITLNIPEDSDFAFKNKKLRINKIDHFDILDGYHRFRAMQEIYLRDNSFDYVMELRIVSYPEEMAKQFIWQEDQKTKMRRVDADYMNQNAPGNQVVNELENSIPFIKILGKNGMSIDAAIMSKTIDIIFFDNKKAERKEIVNTKKIIIDCAKILEAEDIDAFYSKWNNGKIVAFVMACYQSLLDEDTNLFLEDFTRIMKVISDGMMFNRKYFDVNEVKKVKKLAR